MFPQCEILHKSSNSRKWYLAYLYVNYFNVLSLIFHSLHVPWAVPWLRWLVASLSTQRLKSVYVEYVVDKVALGQVSLQDFRFSPIRIFPAWFDAHTLSGV
jgi:hypothetical protein